MFNKIIYTVILFIFCLNTPSIALDEDFENNILFILEPIDYHATHLAIQGVETDKKDVFSPFQTTLHELFTLHDKTKENHKKIHDELKQALTEKQDSAQIIQKIRECGLGVTYKKGEQLTTTLKGIQNRDDIIKTPLKED